MNFSHLIGNYILILTMANHMQLQSTSIPDECRYQSRWRHRLINLLCIFQSNKLFICMPGQLRVEASHFYYEADYERAHVFDTSVFDAVNNVGSACWLHRMTSSVRIEFWINREFRPLRFLRGGWRLPHETPLNFIEKQVFITIKSIPSFMINNE